MVLLLRLVLHYFLHSNSHEGYSRTDRSPLHLSSCFMLHAYSHWQVVQLHAWLAQAWRTVCIRQSFVQCLKWYLRSAGVQVQEANQCTAVWSEPDPQQAFHPVVVSYHQPCQCVCGFPSAAGSDRHFHAWQDSHAQDLPHPDLPGSLVAEGARERGHGPVSSSVCCGCLLTV